MDPADVFSTGLGLLELLKVVALSSLGAAAISYFKDLHFRSKDKSERAKFAAIRVTAQLDMYAIKSQKNYFAYYEHVQQLEPEQDYRNWPTCSQPELAIEEEILSELSPNYAASLLWIETEKALALQHLYLIHEQSITPIDVYDHEADMVAYFGYEAHLLSKAMKRCYSLSTMSQKLIFDENTDGLRRGWDSTKKELKRVRTNARQRRRDSMRKRLLRQLQIWRRASKS